MKSQIYTYVITPQEFSLLLTKLTADKDAKVQNHDGTYTVNAHGVEGTFSYDNVKTVVTITLDKKPLLLPASFIKKAFDEHIAEVRQDVVDARNGGAPIPTPVQIPKNTIDFKIPGEQFTPSPPSATNPPPGSAIAGTTTAAGITPINPSAVTSPPAPSNPSKASTASSSTGNPPDAPLSQQPKEIITSQPAPKEEKPKEEKPAPITAKAAQPTVTSDKTLPNPVSGNAKIE